jgi:hypothetical protein
MSDDNPTRHKGIERRNEQRRKKKDRRTLIRYEPEKSPRRSGQDRRRTTPDLWDRRDD